MHQNNIPKGVKGISDLSDSLKHFLYIFYIPLYPLLWLKGWNGVYPSTFPSIVSVSLLKGHQLSSWHLFVVFLFFSLKIHRNSFFSLTKPSSITTSNLDLESICSYDRTYTLSQQISLPLFLSCRVNHKTHSSMTSKIDPLSGVSWKSLSFIL